MGSMVKRMFLKPFSLLWESAYRTRRSLYEYGVLKKEYFKVPILSIGNITFGGTGKTPMIIWLIKRLEELELNTVILTRGYKGDLEHKSGIIRGGQKFLSNPQEFGDEPLLISKHMKKGAVIVGKRRSENLKKYFSEIKPDVVLLDDGFQHIELYRSFNIVLFDALLPIDSYYTAPMGYLREGLTALKDADFILISRADQASEDQIDNLLKLLKLHHRKDIPIGKFTYKPTCIIDSFDENMMPITELKGKRVIALTAIASPESFYRLLESYGADIVDKVVYPDHYFFKHEDINEVLVKSAQENAVIITSEKDMVKIRKVIKDSRIMSINIEVQFLSGEEELLTEIKRILHLDYN